MRFMDGYRTLARLGLVAGLVGIEVFLARDLTTTGAVLGYTQTQSYSVAPPRRAKLKAVAVQLGATVAAGQPIAELDPTELDNELAAARAERDRAIAAIQAELSALHRDRADVARRFAVGAEGATAQLVTAEAASRSAAAELAAIDRELAEQRDLVAQHLATTTTVNTLALRRAALAKQVDSAGRVLGVLRGNATAATRRTAEVDPEELAGGQPDGAPGGAHGGPIDSALAPLETTVRAAELRIDQLEHERQALTLHSPVDGVVEQLPLHPGDLAGPDVPVATIVASDTRRVVACIPEVRASRVELGLGAELTSAYGHTRGAGEIESLTREIAPLPARCQAPGSKVIAMGRVAVIALDAPLPGLPGETQLVQLSARRHPAARAATATAAAPGGGAPGVLAMTVPGVLLGRTRFEPSGLVWVAALDRYLLVSDDTGFKDRDAHAPWLFTMSADGVVDPRPFEITGIAQLDDLEAIAADRDGKIWVLASNSASKNARRRPARRQLVRLVVDRDGARVDAAVDLGGLLEAAPAATRHALGLRGTGRGDLLGNLDIEAIAVRGGALYLGLKAPLDSDGRAQIWRVTAPDKLLAGDLAGAGLTLWSRLRLAVDADGRSVPGGLADLVFLDAGTVAIASTASGFDPRQQTSVLAVAPLAAGEMQPRVVRRFAGLKAEGLALAPDGKHMTVVFDRGAEAAEWTSISLDELTHAP